MRNLFYILRSLEIVKRLFGFAFWPVFFVGVVVALSFVGNVFAFVGTYSDVTSSRSIGTVYQNTTSNDKQVYFSAGTSDGSNWCVVAYIGATASPATLVGGASRGSGTASGSGSRNMVLFVVPAGYYYKVSDSCSNVPDVLVWWEYTTPAMSGGGATTTALTVLAGTTTNVVHNPAQDMFNGLVIFFAVMVFFIWFFRRPYDTY